MKVLTTGRCFALLCFCLLCVLLAGCAGGASSTTTPGPTPTPTPGSSPTPTPTPNPSPTPTPSPSPTPTPGSHSVSLSWLASSSPNIISYNVYRANGSSGPFAQIGNVSGTSFMDTAVLAGSTYYYEVTAVDNANVESAPTSPVSATVP